MIPFNKPPYTGNEKKHILKALGSNKISGDGPYTQKCHKWFEETLGCDKALLTPSCTAALEMAALLLDIKPGDEVIMPSYTFVSTANAFVTHGARIVFVDICPKTMNIDASLIEGAISDKTKAIVVVHYAGVSCDMDAIMSIANAHKLFVVEDAAQAMMSSYKNKLLGTIGHLGAYSFHETKNYTSGGEGGLLIVNDTSFADRAEVIREKGTNRSQFFRGMVDKYSWVDKGSSYLPSDLQAAYLWGQLEKASEINDLRKKSWAFYYQNLNDLVQNGSIEIGAVPNECQHNAHMFYFKVRSLKERTDLLSFLKKRNVMAVFHYVPLHTSEAGSKYSTFYGADTYTTSESERLIRLPLWYGITESEQMVVINSIKEYFSAI